MTATPSFSTESTHQGIAQVLGIDPEAAESACTELSPQQREQILSELLPLWKPLYRFAYKLCADPQLAEDLTQDTFLKACRYADRYHQGSNPRAWLFQILKNGYINHYRRGRYAPLRMANDDLLLASARHQYRQPTHGGNERRLLGDEVTRALQALPVEYRLVVVLCDLEDFSYEEIAQVVDVPVGTVRSRLHRGRKMLRARLLPLALQRGIVPRKGVDLMED